MHSQVDCGKMIENLRHKPRLLFRGAMLGLLVFTILSNEAWGQIRAGSAYLKILPGTRQQSLGSGMTGALDGTFSLYSNPGAAGLMRQWHLSGSYNKWIADIYNISLIGGRQFRANLPWGDRFYAAAGINYQGFGDFDATGLPQASVSAQDLLLTGHFGFPITKVSRNLSAGFNVKYLRSELAQFSANALVFDTGLIYRTPRFRFPLLFEEGIFSIGGAVTQLGKSMTFVTEGTPLPRTLRLGTSLNVGAHDRLQLQLVGDYRKVRSEVSRVSLGGEIMNFLSPLSPSLGRVVSLRGGYVFNSEQETSLVSKYAFSFSFRLDDYMNDLLFGSQQAMLPINTALRNDLGALGSSRYANVLQISSDWTPIGPEGFDFEESLYHSTDPEHGPAESFRVCDPVQLRWHATRDPDLYDDVNYILLVGRERGELGTFVEKAKRNQMSPGLRRAYNDGFAETATTEVKLIEITPAMKNLIADDGTLSMSNVAETRVTKAKEPVVSYTLLDEPEPSPNHPVGTFYWSVLAYDRNGHYRVVGDAGRHIARFDVRPDPTLELTITNTVPVADGYISNVTITNTTGYNLTDSVLVQVAGIDSTELVVELPERLAGLGIDVDRTGGTTANVPVDSLLEVRVSGIGVGESRTLQVRWQKDYPYLIATVDPERRFLCIPVRDTLSLYDLRIEQVTDVPPLRPGVRFAFNRYQLGSLEKGSRGRLDIIRESLRSKELSHAYVKLEGHTDQTGFRWNRNLVPAERKAADMRDNLALSRKRIATVKSYLESGDANGADIDSSRFCAVGFGQEKPRSSFAMPSAIKEAFRKGLMPRARYQALVDSMDRRVEIYLLNEPVPCDRSEVPENVRMKVVMKGSEFKYKLRVKNDGPNTAYGARVWQTLPSYLEITQVDSVDGFTAHGDTVYWTVDRLQPGETSEINLVVRVAELPNGAIVRKFTATSGVSAAYDLNSANNLASTEEIIAIGGKITEIPFAEAAGRVPDVPVAIRHEVRRGESLSIIASRYSGAQGYRITWSDIYHVNEEIIGPYPNAIEPGMLLRIPARSELCPADEAPATVGSVRIEGKLAAGETLVGTYVFTNPDDRPEGKSRYRWLRNGRPIDGATASTYTVQAADLEAKLTFEVTPVSLARQCPVGSSGRATLGSGGPPADRGNRAPKATDVRIEGDCQVGSRLRTRYKFLDPDGDREGATVIRWLRNGEAIAGATREVYEIQLADAGRTLAVEIIPRDKLGAKGIATQSSDHKVPRRLLPGQECGQD